MAFTPTRFLITAIATVACFTLCAAPLPTTHHLDMLEHIPSDEINAPDWLKKNHNASHMSAPTLRSPSVRLGKSHRLAHHPFTGIPDYIRAGHNITKLSHMLHRVIHKYNITSMVDVPCRAHSRWMGLFLEHIELPTAGKQFKYFCVDSSRRILDMAASRITDMTGVSVSFLNRKFWRERIPTADLVFCWEGLEKMRVNNVRDFLERLRKGGRHRYLLVGTSPTVKSNKGDLSMNVKRAPFSYGMPMRIFKALAVERSGDDMFEKQMYLYSFRDMKRG